MRSLFRGDLSIREGKVKVNVKVKDNLDVIDHLPEGTLSEREKEKENPERKEERKVDLDLPPEVLNLREVLLEVLVLTK